MSGIRVPAERRLRAESLPDVPPVELEEHLIEMHGLDPVVVRRQDVPGARRQAFRYLQMQHSIDHAQRFVGHEHNAE